MIEIKNLTKTFNTADGTVEALRNVSLSIPDGDIFGIIGMSGAGKSTLVRCINMLERPTEGTVEVDGVDLGSLSAKELRAKRHDITMIFQGFNLLMQKNCLKNVCFPLELQGMKGSDAKKRAMELLDIVGLADKAKAYPAQLSGGQQQRVAIARALTTQPKVLLCDEATSALDPNTTNSILELIKEINARMGITVVVITHQMSVVESICKHVAILDGGEVVEQGEVSEVFAHPKSQAARNLVFPEGEDSSLNVGNAGEHFIRVVYNGAYAAGKPMIARLAIDKGIEANISYASTKGISGKAFGTILLSISGDDQAVRDTIEYLTTEPGIEAEEVKVHVH
ncbi:MAG: ATP-binding cassette domain-containing protein [Lachnospiraceae bacterium]|nr:ATP-binding cassette domain-containing protein [Lachnospiraceae bacterium]MBR6349488.1 ATP-binding cassette domain-containing protein [Lachnospiraceae bacterium]